jgi:hypothetical protein
VFWVGILTVPIALVMALNLAWVPADARAGLLEGRVWKVDPDARMIHVSSRLFGLGATPVVITNDTLVIADNKKEGAFGDLHEGLLVRVAWEKRQGAWLARAVEVGGQMGEPARPSEILSILERVSAPEPALPASTISDEPSAESRRAEPSRVSPRPAAKVAPAQGQTPAVNLMRGSHVDRDRAPASSPHLAPAPTSAPSDRAAATGETVATPREPDPTAIIDWLLKRVP